MEGELCRIRTEDGFELHGLLAKPRGDANDIGLIHVHGLAGNFYENPFIDHVADAAVRLGVCFLTISTRGRDYISDFLWYKDDGSTGYRQIGAVYEKIEECILDIGAWVDFLASRGFGSIILQGHSHGAIKVTYYLCRTADPRVVGLVLLSPSDDFGLQRRNLGNRFEEALDMAKQMVLSGMGRQLMPQGYFDYPVSAATYYDMFRPDSPIAAFNLSQTERNDFPELASTNVATLVVVGSETEAFVGEPQAYLEAIRSRMTKVPAYTGHVIFGAPHNYLGYEKELADKITSWLNGLLGGGIGR